MTGDSTKALKVRVLDSIPRICYPVQFCKDKGKDVLALLHPESKKNAITAPYIVYLGLKRRLTNLGMQKIEGSSLTTYGMVIAAFQVVDKLGHPWFFQKTF